MRAGLRAQRDVEARRRAALSSAVATLRRGGSGGVSEGGGFAVQTRSRIVLTARHVAESDGPGWLEISASAAIPTDLVIGRETLGTRIGKALLTGPDVETGDAELDRLVLLRGSEARLLAILDKDTRQQVRAAVAKGCSVVNGNVTMTAKGDLAEAGTILDPARTAESLAATLTSRSAQMVTTLLRENAMGDPDPGVRRRNLEVLVEQFPAHAETRVALDAASVDTNSSVRLFAASRVGGAGGMEKVEALAALVLDLHLEPDVRADAMRQLAEANAGARVIEVAERRIEDRNPGVRLPAIGIVGRARRAAMMPVLLAIAERATDARELEALADAFWRLRDPSAEGALLAMLRNVHTPVKLAAARALGRVGSVAAVESLRAQQGLLAGEIGRVAEEAIAAIQARARHASEGQLAVSDAPAEGGQVSVAPAGRGAVSVPAPQGPRKT